MWAYPSRVWIMLTIVFASELATYTIMFSFFTYCTNILKTGSVNANAIINAVYLVTPLTTCLVSGVADGRFGRRRLLMLSLVCCLFGYWLVAISSMPFMFSDFPLGPYASTTRLCIFAVFVQCVGMGCLKVCTNPMMADEITLHYQRLYDRSGQDCRPCENAEPAEDVKHTQHEDGARVPRTITTYSSNVDCALGAAMKPSDVVCVDVTSSSHGKESNSSSSAVAAAYDDDADRVTEERNTSDYDSALERSFTSLFRYVYWVSNMGALIGTFIMPLLRNVDQRRVQVGSGDYSVGYYYGFSLAAVSLTLGLIMYVCAYRQFSPHVQAPTFLLFRLVISALRNRVAFAFGSIVDDCFRPRDWLDYACYHRMSSHLCEDKGSYNENSAAVLADESGIPHGPSHAAGRGPAHSDGHSESTARLPNGAVLSECDNGASSHSTTSAGRIDKPHRTVRLHPSSEGVQGNAHRHEEGNYADATAGVMQYDDDSDRTAQWLEGTRRVLHLCVVFLPLPIYWLVCNQFSTTLMFLGVAVDLPSYIPPDVFNNISTITLLAFLPLFEYCICCHWNMARTLSARARMSFGFLLLCASMIWCGVVQTQIDRRGRYVAPSDEYVLYTGDTKVSASWLIVPYVLQGLASSFVDTTSMEVAYTNAPEYMKGTVVGLFSLASSASGLLGLLISPVLRPQNANVFFFLFAGLMFVVTAVFYHLNRHSTLCI